jgi:hypothetical protein
MYTEVTHECFQTKQALVGCICIDITSYIKKNCCTHFPKTAMMRLIIHVNRAGVIA